MSDALTWRRRLDPARPSAVVAFGDAARGLASALVREPSRLEGLRCLAGDDAWAALGEADDLPWVDGARWLAPSGDAKLYLPTYLEPELDPSLVVAALRRTGQPAPWAYLPETRQLVSLARARTLASAEVEAWLKARSGAPTGDPSGAPG